MTFRGIVVGSAGVPNDGSVTDEDNGQPFHQLAESRSLTDSGVRDGFRSSAVDSPSDRSVTARSRLLVITHPYLRTSRSTKTS